MTKRLTQKQETFTQNLFKGMSQREAWIQAGYSSKYAPAIIDVNACKLANSTKIQIRWDELNQKAEDESVATHLEACQVATEIMRGRFSDFATAGADGVYIDVGPEKMHLAALRKVKSKTTYDDNGSNAAVFTDIELESKLDAIEKLAKLKKWYDPDGAVNVDNRTLNIYVNSDKAKSLTERLIEGERTE